MDPGIINIQRPIFWSMVKSMKYETFLFPPTGHINPNKAVKFFLLMPGSKAITSNIKTGQDLPQQ